jgi:hypothetical protein
LRWIYPMVENLPAPLASDDFLVAG